jgi:N-acetylmuramoyl-L-alanine amidase
MIRIKFERVTVIRCTYTGSPVVHRLLLFLLVAALTACAPLPQRADSVARWHPSPNFDERKPNFVIIHNTGSDDVDHALDVLSDSIRRVSAHYVISRDGTIYQMVEEKARAWHAGVSKWGDLTDLNSASIGIELDNNGFEPFPDVQIASLLLLLSDIKTRYPILAANYLAHGDVAPRRKVDPSVYFPWRTLAQHGFGLWCELPLPDAPLLFDVWLGLRAFGYDTSNPEAAMRAFKRHYTGADNSLEFSASDRAVLYCLLSKKMEESS